MHKTIFRGGLHRINDLNVKISTVIKLIKYRRIFSCFGGKRGYHKLKPKGIKVINEFDYIKIGAFYSMNHTTVKVKYGRLIVQCLKMDRGLTNPSKELVLWELLQ